MVRKLVMAGSAPWLPAGRRLLAMLGPGYVVAVGYMDPGNWATDIAGGARYGFALLASVLVASALGAFVQALAVRLTLATGEDLAHLIRQRFPRPLALACWITAEVAMVATDLAELLGSAVALQLLFGLPIAIGVPVGALATLALLALPGAGGRMPELMVGAMVVIIAGSFAWELAVARPSLAAVLHGFVPSVALVRDPQMLYLSLGILGATLMPHNLFLHSGLTRARVAALKASERRQAARYFTLDSTLALALAFAVNAAILVLAAIAFHGRPDGAVAGIEDAYRLLGPALGTGTASLVFAVALLAAGQSATATGAMAGQFVIEGFLDIRLAPWLRGLITRGAALVPALVLPAAWPGEGVDALIILSQVVLALTLPLVLAAMFWLLRDERLMGPLALPAAVRRLTGALVVVLIALNVWLACQSLA